MLVLTTIWQIPIRLLIFLVWMGLLVFVQITFSQTASKKPAIPKKKLVPTNQLQNPNCQLMPKSSDKTEAEIDNEVGFYAKIRYVIVYNYIFDEVKIPSRRMKILMDPDQLTEENLICVFQMISKNFPSPKDLEVEVHTSLMTIETPEEHRMARDSIDSRFSHTYGIYKRASFSRFLGVERHLHTRHN